MSKHLYWIAFINTIQHTYHQCLPIESRKTAIQPLFDVISFQFKKRRTVLTAKQITGNIFPGLIFDGRSHRQEEKEELGEEISWRGKF